MATVLAIQGPAALAAAPEGYQIAQTITVAGGCDCTVEVLEDARITDAIRKDAAETGNGPGGDPALYAPFEQSLPKSVAIQIVNRQGHVTDRRDFDVPLATLDGEPIRIGLPVPMAYKLTVVRHGGEMRFSGSNSYFFSIDHGRFSWISYVDDGTHTRRELTTLTDMRNEFSIVDRRDHRGKDFLLVHCELGADGAPTTTYMRVHFAQGEWRAKSRSKPGDFCQGDR